MTTVYERLKALQITLPDVPVPVVAGYDAAFVPFVRTGNLVYCRGAWQWTRPGQTLRARVNRRAPEPPKVLLKTSVQ